MAGDALAPYVARLSATTTPALTAQDKRVPATREVSNATSVLTFTEEN